MLDGLDATRARADRVLYQADQIAGQVASILARSRAEIERSVTNVRDATDWANKTSPEDLRQPVRAEPLLQADRTKTCGPRRVYDTALVFTKGAQELRDAVKTIETMLAQPVDPQQQQETRPASAEYPDRWPSN